MKTSLSDISAYKNICKFFVEDEDAFRRFRSYSKAYNSVLEHVTSPLGEDYLEEIIKNLEFAKWDSKKLFDFARINDTLGTPLVFDYGEYGIFSPTTLRYLKVLLDIVKHFDLNKHTSIVEIGAGYGGQCRLISDYFGIKNYAIIDLPVVLELQKKYLDHFNVQGVKYFSKPYEFVDHNIDFVISNFAFDELLNDFQKECYYYIVSKASMGYISGGWLSGQGILPIDLVVRKNGSSKKYVPQLKNNCMNVMWGNNK